MYSEVYNNMHPIKAQIECMNLFDYLVQIVNQTVQKSLLKKYAMCSVNQKHSTIGPEFY